MPSGKVTVLTYTAKSADAIGSFRYFQDLMDTDDDWISYNLEANGAEYFDLQTAVVKSGSAAWKAQTIAEQTDFTLEPIQPSIFTVSGNKPVLRFWHRFETETGVDAGILEIKKANELVWQPVLADKSFRNKYTGKVAYNTFALPFLSGFSGNSNGWVQSYFDLSAYAGQDVNIRFRFGTNEDNPNNPLPTGTWYVDEMEVMDMLNFDGEACVFSGNDQACAKAPERGVIVQPGLVSTGEPSAADQLSMLVQPNPASDLLHLSVGQALRGAVLVQLSAADGRSVLSQTLEGLSEGQIITLDIQQVPAGVYMARIDNAAGSSVKKVVIR
jgi:hypothetical protein